MNCSNRSRKGSLGGDAEVQAVLRSGWGNAALTFARASCVALLGAAVFLAGCQRTESVQRGARGTSLLNVYDPAAVAAASPLHHIPDPEPADPPDPDMPPIKDVFKNVQVLDDLTVLEFSRLMQAFATWIAPDQGCDFCHNPKQLDSDEKYPKRVARLMIKMTRQINTEWKDHVKNTGVTCWTCHRGQAVPTGDWFANPGGPTAAGGFLGFKAGQNQAGIGANGNTALPLDALSVFLNSDTQVRIQGNRALAGENKNPLKQAEWTYSLMIYISQSLGVNCTYCHNTRAMRSWEESSPQRSTAWYGIRMVRFINKNYLTSQVGPLLPPKRLSAEGDFPKVACMTCHKGAFKPLFGVSMLGDYPELAGKMVRTPEGAASAPQ